MLLPADGWRALGRLQLDKSVIPLLKTLTRKLGSGSAAAEASPDSMRDMRSRSAVAGAENTGARVEAAEQGKAAVWGSCFVLPAKLASNFRLRDFPICFSESSQSASILVRMCYKRRLVVAFRAPRAVSQPPITYIPRAAGFGFSSKPCRKVANFEPYPPPLKEVGEWGLGGNQPGLFASSEAKCTGQRVASRHRFIYYITRGGVFRTYVKHKPTWSEMQNIGGGMYVTDM